MYTGQKDFQIALMQPTLRKCILESTFSSGDSALHDKSVILRGGLAHYRPDKSLRPPLENTNLSSQILESSSGSEKQAQILESTFTKAAYDPYSPTYPL